MRRKQHFAFVLLLFACLRISVIAQSSVSSIDLRFVDSATGFGVQPQVVLQSASATIPVAVPSSGRVVVSVEPGDYTLTATSEKYEAVSAAISVGNSNSKIQFTLDPVSRPFQLQTENVIALHRAGVTVFLGFVSGDDTGQALVNARIFSSPSGIETHTDADGYFQIAVPLQSDEEWAAAPAKLIFEKNGYQTDVHQNLELASNADWIFRVSLIPGTGTNVVDEGGRRFSALSENVNSSSDAAMQTDSKSPPVSNLVNPTNATLRVPTNIRVAMTNGTIEYVSMETYTARSLAQEWISSWGDKNNRAGMNSMRAGAVAVRSYAAARVNSASSTSTSDICSTTSCQVYRASSTANSDQAAAETRGYVVTSGGSISSSEYSAENNSDGFSCGDGYTQPTGGCVYDPVCTGEVRFGHGRGMCQWGTARWATGWKMALRNSNDSTPNGFPAKDWMWIVNHYYPSLTLAQGQPMVVGDDVKLIGSSSRDVRMCGDGSISSGVACPLITTKAPGATGFITNGPVRVTTDGRGFTWWKIVWSDGAVGWTAENWLDRIVPAVVAPGGLTATAVSSNQINLNWTDSNNYEAGFRIERAYSASGPWRQIKEVGINTNSFSDTKVLPANTYYYRVRAYNVTGNSSYSNTTNATTTGLAPVLSAIANRTVVEGTTLTFTNSASASDFVQSLADFEGFDIETSTGAVLFRSPRNSVSTSTNLNANPDYASVTDLFPTNANAGSRALFVNCEFTNAVAPWVRLTTASASFIPNPVINFTRRFQFQIYSDKAIKVGLGLRETTTSAGTVLGTDGGTTGAIEWIGVTNKNGAAPVPNRNVTANTWTTLTYNLPAEPTTNFNAGNNVLSTVSGLGVFEHLAIVPTAGTGLYKIYLDNFSMIWPKTLTYGLRADAPAGASIHPTSGVFTWTPTEVQGPGTNTIAVIVTDNSPIPRSTTNTFTVVVTETNAAPVLAAIANRTVHAGMAVTVTNSASDSDFPTNILTFSLDPGAPAGATINAANGVFTWTPADVNADGTSNVTVRVTDNGSPVRSDAKTFGITVMARPGIQNVSFSNGNVTFSWSAIAGKTYRVQYKASLDDPNWTDLSDLTAGGSTASFVDQPGAEQRYYRILVLN